VKVDEAFFSRESKGQRGEGGAHKGFCWGKTVKKKRLQVGWGSSAKPKGEQVAKEGAE